MAIARLTILGLLMILVSGRAAFAAAPHGASAGSNAVGFFLVDQKAEDLRKPLKLSLESVLDRFGDQGLRLERIVRVIASPNPPSEIKNKYLGYVDVGRSGDSYRILIRVPEQGDWREERSLSVRSPEGLEPHRSVIAAWLLSRVWDQDNPCPDMTSEKAKEASRLLSGVMGAWKSSGSWTPSSLQAQLEFRAELLRDLDKRIVRCPGLRTLKL